MKKLLVILMALALTLPCALAEDLGVQMIGPDMEPAATSLEDVQLGQTYTIEGYATITPKEYMVTDYFAQFKKDADYTATWRYGDINDAQVCVYAKPDRWWNDLRWTDAYWNDSGLNGQFLWFMVDITNLQMKDESFLENASVKAYYQEEYELTGWVRQVNYDYLRPENVEQVVTRYNFDTPTPNVVVLDPDNAEPISMLYTGTYVFGVTVPNTVVDDAKASLRLEITLGDSLIIYNIHK